MEKADQARKARMYGLSLPGLIGIGEEDIQNPYSRDHLADLKTQEIANRVKKQRLAADLGDLTPEMVRHPEEYLLNTAEKRAQMAKHIQGASANTLAGLGMLASLGAPAALGTGMMARGLSGAALSAGFSAPSYMASPETADPLLDIATGAGAGIAGIPGMIVGGLLGYSPEAEAGASGKALSALKKAGYWLHGSKADPLIRETGRDASAMIFPHSLHLTQDPQHASFFAMTDPEDFFSGPKPMAVFDPTKPSYAEGGQVVGALKRMAKYLDDKPVKRGVADIVKERGGNWVPYEESGWSPGPELKNLK